ncbi:MAG: hypothetical protein JKX94_10035 [Sneathiella sp.]|nr:hypothetical protein [Sneathiella sp.]
MNISRTGIILNTEKYVECVQFYKDLFGFDTLYEEKESDFRLTRLDFCGTYLMIETGGTAKSRGRSIVDSPVKLRINVSDIEQALKTIENYGIKAVIVKSDWGSTINIFDPDGNRVGIRDDATFVGQMKRFQK